MVEDLIEISDDYELKVGDEIVMDHEWLTENQTLRAAQWALIEDRLEKKYIDFEIREFQNLPDVLRIRARVTGSNPVVLTPFMIKAAIFGAATIFTIWLIGHMRVYLAVKATELAQATKELAETPAAQSVASGVKAAGIAALVAVVYLVFLRN